MVRVGRPLLPAFLALAWPFLPLVSPWRLLVQPHAHRQGPDLGRGPGRVDDQQREDHPVVSPTDVGPLAAGDQRVVMHAGAEDGQPALAAEGVVDAQLDRPLGEEGRDRLACQRLVEVVDRPGGVAEEAMVSAVVAAMDGAGGLDHLGDVAVAVGEAPAGGDGEEGGEGGAVKTERNWSRSERKVGVSCMCGLLVARGPGC